MPERFGFSMNLSQWYRATRPFFAALACFVIVGGSILYLIESRNVIRHTASATDRAALRQHILDNSEAIILPVTARDEEWQSTTQESMFNFVRLSDGGIRRLDNVRPEVEILCELARRLVPAGTLDFDEFRTHDTIATNHSPPR